MSDFDPTAYVKSPSQPGFDPAAYVAKDSGVDKVEGLKQLLRGMGVPVSQAIASVQGAKNPAEGYANLMGIVVPSKVNNMYKALGYAPKGYEPALQEQQAKQAQFDTNNPYLSKALEYGPGVATMAAGGLTGLIKGAGAFKRMASLAADPEALNEASTKAIKGVTQTLRESFAPKLEKAFADKTIKVNPQEILDLGPKGVEAIKPYLDKQVPGWQTGVTIGDAGPVHVQVPDSIDIPAMEGHNLKVKLNKDLVSFRGQPNEIIPQEVVGKAKDVTTSISNNLKGLGKDVEKLYGDWSDRLGLADRIESGASNDPSSYLSSSNVSDRADIQKASRLTGMDLKGVASEVKPAVKVSKAEGITPKLAASGGMVANAARTAAEESAIPSSSGGVNIGRTYLQNLLTGVPRVPASQTNFNPDEYK